jgi:hypothetical protein
LQLKENEGIFILTVKAKIRQDTTREPPSGAEGSVRTDKGIKSTKAAVHRGK